jgi:hypothetical protein
MQGNAVSAVGFVMEVIVPQLIPNDQKDHQTGGYTNGKSEHIQQYIAEIALHGPECGEQITSEHGKTD